MPRVQCRRCPFTGRIFEEKDLEKYRKHLSEIRNKKRIERKNASLRADFKSWITKEKESITHIDMICPWFIKNQRTIMAYTNAIAFQNVTKSNRNVRFTDSDNFHYLTFKNVKYNSLVSNSHVCPESGVTNWCARSEDRPIGYKGWAGYLHGSLLSDKDRNYCYPYSEALNLVGIKTGSGGGGNASFGYNFSVFLDDWPGLAEQVSDIEQELIFKKLS